jgi:hypothetical protein
VFDEDYFRLKGFSELSKEQLEQLEFSKDRAGELLDKCYEISCGEDFLNYPAE